MRCPRCNAENPDGSRYCHQCAADLTATSPFEAERRQLTVLFCDLVGSTQVAERLDAEDLRDLYRRYQDVAAAAVEELEGHVAEYLGDGVVVYFGHPVSHEDDPVRAVRAGLRIVERTKELNERLSSDEDQPPLDIRVGIHTGVAVVGEMGRSKDKQAVSAVGETVNIAARLQAVAAPNEVVISSSTAALVEGFFETASLGKQELKGISRPIEVRRVIADTGAQTRWEATAPAQRGEMLGRDQEMGRLLELWRAVQQGRAVAALVGGEAGIGKSRLVHQLREQLGASAAWLEARCSPYHVNTAFLPIAQMLNRVFGISASDDDRARLERLEAALSDLGIPARDAVSLLAPQLSIALPDRYPPSGLAPHRARHRMMETVVAVLDATSRRGATVFLVEDLHWSDPSTLEFLGLLLADPPAAPLLTVMTHRSEFHPRWEVDPDARLFLDRLPPTETRALAVRTAGAMLPSEVLHEITSRTDGVPLFVEELTKMLTESELLQRTNGSYSLVRSIDAAQIPSTLQDSLMARLDRLGRAKQVAQVGATIGREFGHKLLELVAELDNTALEDGLGRLVDAELVHSLPGATRRYAFKHALVQETAYGSLLKRVRRDYHQRIAVVLRETSRELAALRPEVLAHHFTEAGLLRDAVTYWLQAGQGAVARSANQEAVNHLRRGLKLVEQLPDDPETRQQELALRVSSVAPLIATKGYTAAEVGEALVRARELCLEIGDTPQMFPVVYGLWLFYIVATDFKTGAELAEQSLDLARRSNTTDFLIEGHCAGAVTAFYRADFDRSRDHCERVIELYDRRHHAMHAHVYGQDPGQIGYGYLARLLPLIGDEKPLEGAVAALRDSVDHLDHQHSRGAALMHLTVASLHARRGHEAREWGDRLISLSTEQELWFWLAMGYMLRGAAAILEALPSGDHDRITSAIEEATEGLTGYRALGAGLDVPACACALAEGLASIGQIQEALRIIDETLAQTAASGQRYFDAELERVRGTLLAQHDRRDEAQDAYHRALSMAERQRALGIKERIERGLELTLG